MLCNKYNKLSILSNDNITKGSNKIILCVCDCGRQTYVKANHVISGHTKSCGKCNFLTEKELNQKYGKLKIASLLNISRGSGILTKFKCDCGSILTVPARNVFSGKITSCKRCNQKKKHNFSIGKTKTLIKQMTIPHDIVKNKFGKLQIKIPQDIKPWSQKEILWICDCGKEKYIKICKVLSGHIKSCGECNYISSDMISQQKFGKLRIETPINTKPFSSRLVRWICDCGNITTKSIASVISGNTSSCGMCNVMPIDQISTRKFGSLRIANPISIKPNSNKYIDWICDCGKIVSKKISHVTSGAVLTCGRCRETIYDWYIHNKIKLNELKYPIHPNQIPDGGIIALESIKCVGKTFKSKCPICKSDWAPTWGHVKSGESLTCGCVSNKISKCNIEIFDYIKSLGFNPKLEHCVNGRKYDIFVPEKNFLIEYNGKYWHSIPGSTKRDAYKIKLAIDNGYKITIINEEDWYDYQSYTKERLMYLLTIL
jgi:hypothetical protein